MTRKFISIVLTLLTSVILLAQVPQTGKDTQGDIGNRHSSRWSIETNVADLGFLGTVNGTAQFAMAQHFT